MLATFKLEWISEAGIFILDINLVITKLLSPSNYLIISLYQVIPFYVNNVIHLCQGKLKFKISFNFYLMVNPEIFIKLKKKKLVL